MTDSCTQTSYDLSFADLMLKNKALTDERDALIQQVQDLTNSLKMIGKVVALQQDTHSIPRPYKKRSSKGNSSKPKRELTEYNKFLKENLSKTKQEMEDKEGVTLPQKQILALTARKWQTHKKSIPSQ